MRHGSVVLGIVGLVSLLARATLADEPKRTLDFDQPRRTCNVLPSAVSRHLASELPGYRPASAHDYDAGWFDAKSEWSLLNKSWFNWIVRGDFDGNGATDYALLMRGSENGEERTALIAVRATKTGWTHDVLESWGALSEIHSAIYTAAPGRISMELADAPDPELKPLFTTSLFLTALESCGLNHYYWEKGGWKKAYVGL